MTKPDGNGTSPHRRIVLLLPTATYRAGAFMEAAARLGIDVVVATEHAPPLATEMEDRLVDVDFDRPEESASRIAAFADRTPLDAVIGVDDQGVLTAAHAGELLGLAHNPPDAVAATRDKIEMRSVLDAWSVPQPAFRVVTPGSDVATLAVQVGLPCVIKPTSLSASTGVIRADTPEGAVVVAERVRDILVRHGRRADEPLLVEEFVGGAEVALEGVLRDGELRVLAVFDKPDPLVGPYFEETIYLTPSRLSSAERDAVIAVTTAGCRALGLREGPVHAELRVGGPHAGVDGGVRVLEIAARTGTLVVEVSATGNLQPTNQVDVGSELSGIIERVYVDENDRVKKGQVLAVLDDSKLNDAVQRSRAALAAAEAQALQAEATVAEKQAALKRLQRVAAQSNGAYISPSDMDTAEANAKRADADLASARAGVAQARAALKTDETNLTKASIRSPIDGIVLTRKVEPGQTVAASFQAPVLFTLAENLTKMELQVDVDEADVGQVKVGQQATFTVDAWPGRRHHAVISRVGYGSQEKNGVISYLTVLDVSNDDLSLRPGMTGTAQITTVTRDRVLLAPNAALRFSPPTADATPQKKRGSVVGALMPRPPQAPRPRRPPPFR